MFKKARSYIGALWSMFGVLLVLVMGVSIAMDGIKTLFSSEYKGQVVQVDERMGRVDSYRYEVSEQHSLLTYKIEDEWHFGQRYQLGDDVTFYTAGDGDYAQFYRGLSPVGIIGMALLAFFILSAVWLFWKAKTDNKPKRPGRTAPGHTIK